MHLNNFFLRSLFCVEPINQRKIGMNIRSKNTNWKKNLCHIDINDDDMDRSHALYLTLFLIINLNVDYELCNLQFVICSQYILFNTRHKHCFLLFWFGARTQHLLHVFYRWVLKCYKLYRKYDKIYKKNHVNLMFDFTLFEILFRGTFSFFALILSFCLIFSLWMITSVWFDELMMQSCLRKKAGKRFRCSPVTHENAPTQHTVYVFSSAYQAKLNRMSESEHDNLKTNRAHTTATAKEIKGKNKI